jgi:hypothetical protein
MGSTNNCKEEKITCKKSWNNKLITKGNSVNN